jgi:hypothetical protein
MVELMVVIAIIGILVAIGVGAGYVVIAGMRVSATENAMLGVQKVLNEQWNQVIEEAKLEQPSPAVLALANGDTNRARVLWIKLRLFEAFPENYGEIRNAMASAQGNSSGLYGGPGGTLGPWLPVRKYMATYFGLIPTADGPNHDTNTESSACLMLALNITRGQIKLNQANLTSFIADTDGDNVPELIDKWGNALQFQRWWGPNPLVTNVIAVNPPIAPLHSTPPPSQNSWWVASTLLGGPNAGSPTTIPWNTIKSELAQLNPRSGGVKAQFGDPVDPDGLLQQNQWYATIQGQTFAALINHPFPKFPLGAGVTTPQPYYVPYIFSTGPNDPTNPRGNSSTGAPFYDTNTYIFSYRLKVGSQ